MAFPRRGARRITVGGVSYLWKPQLSAGNYYYALPSGTALLVQREDNPASVLAVELPTRLEWRAVIRPAYVAAFITLARSRGWRPAEPGPGFFLALDANAPAPPSPYELASLDWRHGTGSLQTSPVPTPVVPQSPGELTEAEWLQDLDSRRPFDFARAWAGGRKLRLFAVACCRLLGPLLGERDEAALLVAERLAEGMATNEERKIARHGSHARITELLPEHGGTYHEALLTAQAVDACLEREEGMAAYQSWQLVRTLLMNRTPHNLATANAPLCRLLRCFFGNPFHPVAFDPGWLAWNDGAIVRIARHVYDARAFRELPILADALEDAGCTDAATLVHGRAWEEYARGGWLLDLILGLE
jgi:hypothetical protein